MKYWKSLEGENTKKGFKFVNKTNILFNVYHSNGSEAKEYRIVTRGFKNIVEVNKQYYEAEIKKMTE